MMSINNLRVLIREIIEEEIIEEGVNDPGILKCVFMAGGPGSGKSYTASVLFGIDQRAKSSFSATGLKVVNSDPAFEAQLRKNGIDPKDLWKIEKQNPELWDKIINDPEGIRNTAKRVKDLQKKLYEKGRLGMIIDGTGDDYAKLKKRREQAKSLGYDTYMVFVNTTLEVALERNAKRDRQLPEDLVKEIWNDVQQNLGKFQGLFGSSNFTVVDNTKYGPLAKSIQKEVDRFIRKPIENPIGKKWIEAQQAVTRALGN